MQLECPALVKELTNSNSQFLALEVMCCGRAAAPRKEMEYWLSEAEEWAQLRKAKPQRPCPDHSVGIANIAAYRSGPPVIYQFALVAAGITAGGALTAIYRWWAGTL